LDYPESLLWVLVEDKVDDVFQFLKHLDTTSLI
jgi:hypothetical protein